jgi:hypothetical protein
MSLLEIFHASVGQQSVTMSILLVKDRTLAETFAVTDHGMQNKSRCGLQMSERDLSSITVSSS